MILPFPTLYLKLAAAAVAIIVIGFVLWRVKNIYDDHLKLPEIVQQRDELLWMLEQQDQDIANVQEASDGYQAELSLLRDSIASRPARVVRVYVPAPSPKPAQVPSTEPRPDGATPGTGVLPQNLGPDIGPELYGLAERGDLLSAQVRGLQEYARGCSANEQP